MLHSRARRLPLIVAVATSLLVSGLGLFTPTVAQADDALETAVNSTLAPLTTAQRNRLMYGDGCCNTVAQPGVPAMNMSDGPLGVTDGGLTSIGSGLVLASTWNRDLVHQIGVVFGKEAKARSKEMHLGPGVNLLRDLGGGRVFEYYSEDPYLTAQVTEQYVAGEQSQKVAVTIKHILANNVETNRNWVTSNMSERTMHEVYLAPYRTAVKDADAWGLMTSAARVNGTFVSDNRYVLTNLAKDDWGFSGLVMTDWSQVRTDIISAKAGLDISMPSPGAGYDKLAGYVASGKLQPSAIDNAAQRIIRVAKLTDGGSGENGTQANRNVALNVAREGIVLLKNQGNVLPISSTATQVALLGKYVNQQFEGQGSNNGGSSNTRPANQISYLAGLNNYKSAHSLSTNYVVPTYSEASEAALTTAINDAVAAATASDYAIIFAGINKGNPYTGVGPDSEDGDVFDLSFPNAQQRLIKAVAAAAPGKTIVVMNGSAREIRDWVDDVPGVITQFYAGVESGTAVAEILYGDTNPSGKLTFTWPKRYTDTEGFIASAAATDAAQKAAKTNDVFYTEGVNMGYRYHDANNVPYEYPFGYGLSYTNFSYGTPSLSDSAMGPEDTITVSVPVTNTGSRDGKEVVQMYINDPVASVDRPLKELKDFTKLDIPAGQTKTATFTIDKDDLSFWDVDTHSFKAEAGQFNVWIGGSSASLPAQASFTLTSSTDPDPDYTVLQAEANDSSTGVSTAVNYEVDDPDHTVPVNHIVFDSASSAATWNVTVPTAGKYSIIARYSNDSYSGVVATNASFGRLKYTDLVVNGVLVGKYDFQNTRYQNVWNYDSIDVNLVAGANTIKLQATDDTPGLRVDKLVVQKLTAQFPDPAAAPANDDFTPPETTADGDVYQAENGRELSDATIASGYTGYTGTGYVELASAGAFVMDINADARMASRLQVHYANGSNAASPVDVYVNATKICTLTLGTTGGWDSWKYEQTISLPFNPGNNVVRFEATGGSKVLIDKVLVYGGMGYVDEVAPIINGTSPNDAGETIHPYAEVYFSEKVELGSGNVTLKDENNNTVPATATLVGNVLRVSGVDKLEYGKMYTATVAADAVHDILDANNGETRDLAAPYTFQFYTRGPAPVSDSVYIYSGTWTDDGNGNKVSSSEGASVEFYYTGTKAVVFGSGSGDVDVIKEDLEVSDTSLDLSSVVGEEILSTSYPDGVHYVQLTVQEGASLTFGGAAIDGGDLIKPLSKTGWSVSTFANLYTSTEPKEGIIDGDRGQRWPAGSFLAPGDWVSFDFGAKVKLNALTLVSRDDSYFRGYEVYTSSDGQSWGTPISTGTLSSVFDTMRFPTVETRYLKLVSTGSSTTKWLCINEVYAFLVTSTDRTPPTVPTNVTAAGYNGFIRLDWPASADESAITYRVYRDGQYVGETMSTYFVDPFIDNATSYEYAVDAIDDNKNVSAKSSPVTGLAVTANTQLPRTNWTGTASADLNPATDGPAFAYDGDPNTRYSSGAFQKGTEWYRVDMGAVYPTDRITLDSGGGADYGRKYVVEVSLDGVNYTTVATVNGVASPRIQTITFNPVLARYIRVKQTGTASANWWAVNEIAAYNVNATTFNLVVPSNLSSVGYNGFIRLDWAASTGGLPATAYKVYRDGDLYATTGVNPVFVDTDVNPGQAYTYAVSATALGIETVKSPTVTQATVGANTAIPHTPVNYWVGSAWLAHADYPASRLVDGLTSPFYTSGNYQTAGAWLQADLGSVYPVNQVGLHTDATGDFPTRYKVLVSIDGVTWTTIATNQAGATGLTLFNFTRQPIRYVKFECTTPVTNNWWRADEIYASNITSKAELQAAIAEAQALTASEYSPDSWAAVANALATAVSVDANANATDAEIADATQELRFMLTKLFRPGDATALGELLAQAQALADSRRLEEADRPTLVTAIIAANAVYGDATHKTQAELDAAVAAFQAVLDSFTLPDTKLVLDVVADENGPVDSQGHVFTIIGEEASQGVEFNQTLGKYVLKSDNAVGTGAWYTILTGDEQAALAPSFTAEAFVNPSYIGSSYMDVWGSQQGGGFGLEFNPAGDTQTKMEVWLPVTTLDDQNQEVSTQLSPKLSAMLNYGEWADITVTFDAAAAKITLFVNGEEVDSGTLEGPYRWPGGGVNANDCSNKWFITADCGTPLKADNTWNGLFGGGKLYWGVASAAEIKAVYSERARTGVQLALDSDTLLTEADYTTSTWAELAAAKSTLADLEADPEAIGTQIIAAIDAVYDKIDALAARGDTGALDAFATAVAPLDTSAYTPDSVAAFADALDAAQAIIADNSDATQAEVDAALADLVSALQGLAADPNSAAIQAAAEAAAAAATAAAEAQAAVELADALDQAAAEKEAAL
ncbi:MAG: discoidin domain-containing protein, partial [Propionibacteriaceae bacterium]|nr:discoidin domain-containing protein [Propionibacteriaceae bacterium]